MRLLLPALLLSSTAALAEVPRVATDIPPITSLVAQVMGSLGTPTPVMEAGASPHGYAMRPSETRTLSEADLVVWMGAEIAPWLDRAIETVSPEAKSVALLKFPETQTLDFRDRVDFSELGEAAHEDDHEHEHEEDHAHEDEHGHDDDHDHEAEQGHEQEHAHDEHAEADDHAKHDHAHEGLDTHAWLDPENAKAWLGIIAVALTDLDPENAAIYDGNAKAGQAAIDAAVAEAEATLAAAQGKPFFTFHDAYQYYETRFELDGLGAIKLGDATDPGPARLKALHELAIEKNVVCLFTEPQFDPALADTLIEGTEIKMGQLDPLGQDLPQDASLYPALITDLAVRYADCLAD